MSAFALAAAGTVVVIAVILIANPPMRAGSALFRRWTYGLPAGVADSISEETWKRLVRTYYAGVIAVLAVEVALVRWVVPGRRALSLFTLVALAATFGGRYLVRRYLLRGARSSY